MEQKQPESHGWRDFFVGVVVMLVIIFIAIALSGNSWNPKTGNSPSSGVTGCQAGLASGSGC